MGFFLLIGVFFLLFLWGWLIGFIIIFFIIGCLFS